MKMYTRFLLMGLTVTVFLLVIFSHINSHVGIRPLSLYDDLPRPEPVTIKLARDEEGDSPAFTTPHTAIKTKDKHDGKDKHAKSEKHKIEKSETKQEAAEAPDAPSGTPKGKQPDKDRSPTDTSKKGGSAPESDKGQGKKSSKTEDSKHVLVTHPPTAGLKNLQYPDWWTKAWSRSATSGQGHIFVGDNPLFPPCVQDSSYKPPGKMFKMEEPRNYIKQTKNPCWYDKPEQKRGFRCLPYFYIAGVAKCGTTDMNYRLTLHPDVLKGSMKEYHWWDRYRFEAIREGSMKRGGRSSGPVPFNLYSRMIAGTKGMKQLVEDLKTNGKSDKIFGDSSPSYLWDMHHWDQLSGNEGCTEPRFVIGQHMHHVYPDAKMILTFRHPVPRLYSRFLSRIPRTSYLKGATSASFHEMVVKAVTMYRDCFARWSIRHCAYNQTLRIDAVVRLTEGMYPAYVADWLRIIPRDKLLILRYEDYAKDMKSQLNKIFNFLGLASVNGTEYEKQIFEVEVHNQGSMYTTIGPMKPETEAILNEFYQPFINKFAEILNDERFLWLDTYKKPQM